MVDRHRNAILPIFNDNKKNEIAGVTFQSKEPRDLKHGEKFAL